MRKTYNIFHHMECYIDPEEKVLHVNEHWKGKVMEIIVAFSVIIFLVSDSF